MLRSVATSLRRAAATKAPAQMATRSFSSSMAQHNISFGLSEEQLAADAYTFLTSKWQHDPHVQPAF